MAFKTFIQPDAMDCGPTCLRMIAKFYGRSVSLEKLRHISETTRTGSSLQGISFAAEEKGFKTLGVKIDFENLVENALVTSHSFNSVILIKLFI